MIPLGEGRWAKDLVLPPGTYEYCVVVDGPYLPDPLARRGEPECNPAPVKPSTLRLRWTALPFQP